MSQTYIQVVPSHNKFHGIESFLRN